MRKTLSYTTREQAGVIVGYHPDQGYIYPVRKRVHSRFTGNQDEIVDYLVSNVVWMVIGMIWFRLFAFRVLEHQTLGMSKAVLWGLVLAGTCVGTFLNIRQQRNMISVCFNFMTGFGIYSALAFRNIHPDLIRTVLFFVVAVVFVYVAWKMIRWAAGHPLLSELRRMAITVQRIQGIGFAMIIAALGSSRAFNSALIKVSVPAVYDNIEAQTIQSNMETLRALADGQWERFTSREKLNVLQTVANIEQSYLGLPHELNVGAEDMSREKAGYYHDKTHEIRISMASLLNDSPWELVDSICHEAYHAYQHRLVDLMHETGQESRGLMLFREIREYAEEFQNYTGVEEDFNTYYYQECESNARKYAEESVREYFTRIKDYLVPDSEQVSPSAEPSAGREIMT